MAYPDSGSYIGNNVYMTAVAFTTPMEGRIAYRFGPEIVATGDGGTSWDDMNSMGALCEPRALMFAGPFEGYAVGRGCFGGAYVSMYGGFGWNPPVLLYYGVNQGGLNSIAKDNISGTIVTVGDEGTIFRTTDPAFTTFDTIIVPDTSDMTSVSYAGSNTFYISTSDLFYDVLVSTDGGQTFGVDSTYPLTFFYPELKELDFVTPDWGVAVGTANGTTGIICHKTGEMWDFHPTDFPLNAVFAVDSNLVFAAGDSGKIYRYKRLLGLNDSPGITADQVKIYPNPVSAGQSLTLNLPVQLPVSRLELSDLQGRTIDTRTINAESVQQLSYTVPTIPEGIYFLRLVSGKQIVTSKIIVK
jgi:photosystem II stability/assembly factor-like uncharacterized protein